MVLFDIPFAFLAGGALGWRAKGRRPELAVLFAGVGVAVPGLAFLEAYPDWDLQYLVDPAALPVGMFAAFAATCLLSGFLGHKVGHKNPKVLIALAGALGVFLLVTLPRTLHVGDRAAYLAGDAPSSAHAFSGVPHWLDELIWRFPRLLYLARGKGQKQQRTSLTGL